WVLLGGAAAGVGAAVSGGAGGGGGGGRAGAGFGAASGQQDDDENNTSGGNTRTLPPEALGMLSAAARFPEGPFQWPMGTATPYPSPVGVVVPNFVVHVTTNVDPFNPDSPTHVNQIVRAAGNAVELHGDDVFTSARKSG
ncbi:MAG TPA: hypothetical protein VFJ16_31165, partial [Longimicrobium sp.]|nr:hypothetical protein [Longimicrobium sp.]